MVTCHPCGALTRFCRRGAGLLGACNRRRAAFLELDRQRFDIFDIDLIADLHLREVLHFLPRRHGELSPLRAFQRDRARGRVDRSDRRGELDRLGRGGNARPLADDRRARLGARRHGKCCQNGKTDTSNQCAHCGLSSGCKADRVYETHRRPRRPIAATQSRDSKPDP
jgi:hypothetical protein